MSESSTQETAPLRQFLEYSYLETFGRIARFFELIENDNR